MNTLRRQQSISQAAAITAGALVALQDARDLLDGREPTLEAIKTLSLGRRLLRRALADVDAALPMPVETVT